MVKIGYCGDNCEPCPRYIATLSGDKSELQKVATLWKKVGFRNTMEEPDSLICYGCHFSNVCAYEEVRKCCIEKNIDNCGNCLTYPCEKINKVFKKTKILKKKCKEILSNAEFDILNRAFFKKKDNLDKEKSLDLH